MSKFPSQIKFLRLLSFLFSQTLDENCSLKMGPQLCSRHRVRPWLLEMSLLHCMYKVKEKSATDPGH